MKKISLLLCTALIPIFFSCSANILNDADSIKTSKDAQDRTVAATWTVTFDSQNSANKDAIFTRKVTSPETTINTFPPDPIKQGYSFAGWWTAPNGGGTSFHSDTPVTADITVYAKWSTIPVYLVNFNSQGGTGISNRRVTENGTLKAPEPPTKDGYAFGGWYLEKTCETPWNFDINYVSKNETLFAKWNAYSWAVTFMSGENKPGTAPLDSAATVTLFVISPKMTTETLPENPARNGINFAGWWTNADGTGTQFTSGTPVTANTRVYAKWTGSPVYTVTFDSTGGTTGGSQFIEEGKTAVKPADPEKPGYAFSGWYSSTDGKGSAFSSSNNITANAVFYAYWKSYAYKVVFNSVNNDNSDPVTFTVQTPETTLEKLPDINPHKQGYLFGGWFTELNGNGLEVTVDTQITANTNVYAAWYAYNYAITFLKNDETPEPEPTILNVISPQTHIEGLPAEPSRIGYIFAGWNSAADGNGTNFNTSIEITGNTTVYAKWNKAYVVYFNSNGGSGTMKEQTIAIGTNAPLAQNHFTRDGFTFAGWAVTSYGTRAYADTDVYTPIKAGSMTMYATWTINTYTITFDPNGGKGKMIPITMEYNKTTSLTPNWFNRDNYTFIGWSTEPNKAVAYTNIAIFKIGAENITLYAVWKNNLCSPDSLFTWSVSNKQIQITGLSDEWSAGSDTALILPDNINGIPVNFIEPHAFEKRTSLVSVTIPSTVEKIGDYAFAGCSNLTSFEIPAAVTAIGTGAFNECSNLAKLIADPASKSFVTVNGILLSADKTTLYRFPAGKSDDNFDIAKTITSIFASAFNGDRYLGTMRIPSSVTTIGDGAFSGCTGLDSITLESATPPSLGKSAFDPDATLKINVPKKSLSSYANALNWSTWSNLLAGY